MIWSRSYSDIEELSRVHTCSRLDYDEIFGGLEQDLINIRDNFQDSSTEPECTMEDVLESIDDTFDEFDFDYDDIGNIIIPSIPNINNQQQNYHQTPPQNISPPNQSNLLQQQLPQQNQQKSKTKNKQKLLVVSFLIRKEKLELHLHI
jgi:hypothetical protein